MFGASSSSSNAIAVTPALGQYTKIFRPTVLYSFRQCCRGLFTSPYFAVTPLHLVLKTLRHIFGLYSLDDGKLLSFH